VIVRSAFFLLLLISGLVLMDEVVRACSCAKVGPPCQEYWQSDAIFAGAVKSQKIIEEREEGSDYAFQNVLVHFKIEQAFKGIGGEEVEVVTGLGGGDCGYQFETGKRYLVYAGFGARDKKYLYTGICQRILPLGEAKEDLAYFRALPVAGSGGSIIGRITQFSMNLLKDDEYTRSYPENIRITIEGSSGNFVASTGSDGRYRLSGLSPGRYNIRAELPENLDPPTPREVEVSDRGCAEVDFNFRAGGQISGLVADKEGRPIPNIKVDIIAADSSQESAPKGKRIHTYDQGHYMLNWLPPGKYYLGIGLIGAQSGKCAYPRTYFPGVSDRSKAEIIVLRSGQKLENLNITAPSIPPDLEVELEVEVVWPDGTPLDTGGVTLHPNGHSFPITTEGFTKVSPGVYRIKGFKGCGYWLKAFTYGHLGEPGGGNPWHNELEIEPSKDLTKPLRLVLSKQGFLCRHERP
jgi:hypothetical protein